MIEARDVLRWGGGQHSFVFPETQFITVTAYQNNKVPAGIKLSLKWSKILHATLSEERNQEEQVDCVRAMLLFSDHGAEDQRQPLCQRLPRGRDEQQKVNTDTCTSGSHMMHLSEVLIISLLL